ncbi:MAG TPA: tape measure protein, partial [Caulifigura sp.]|nr:tape measure protein [Caulifigura sp.]
MSTRIQQLVAVFGARFDGFLAGLRRAGTQTLAFRTQSTSAFQSVQQTVTRVSASTVVALDKTAKAAKRTARTHVELEQTVTTAYQQMDESQEEMSASADDGAQQTTKLSEAIQELDAALTQVAQNVYNVLAPIVTESAKAGFALIKLKDNALVSFGGLLGSELRAKVLLSELGDLAAKTPFDMPGVVDLSQRLLAVGVTADQIVPTLTNVGNAVARVGGSKESVEKVTAALIQMMGDAQITNETMRVLTEAGLDPWQALARTIGTDVPTAMDLVAQGAIRTDQVFGTLVANLGANAAGAMAAQNQTLTGLLETLYEKFSEASAKIFEPLYRGLTEFLAWAMGPQGLSLGPMIDDLRDSVEQISDNVFGFFRDNGQRLVEDFGTALTVAADCVVSLTGVLREWGPVVLDAAEAIGSVVKWIIEFVMQCPEVVAGLLAIKALFLTGIPQAIVATIKFVMTLSQTIGLIPTLALAATAAISAWIYQNNKDILEFNKQLERSAELQKQLAEKREKRFQETLTQADQIADPAERKKFLQAEL